MWQIRFRPNPRTWEIDYLHVTYENSEGGLHVVYFGPLVVARHYL